MVNLGEWLSELGRPRILVIGDLILDIYTWGIAERISPEAPVIVLRAARDEFRLGGAASVANLCAALEADVSLAGVIGFDPEGENLKSLLAEAGVDHDAVVFETNRSTTNKQRFMGQATGGSPHQLLRVDREMRQPISRDTEEALTCAVQSKIQSVDVVLISDYGKGTCTPGLLHRLIALATTYEIPVFIDPARSADYEQYAGATLLTPNRLEATRAWGHPIQSPRDGLAAARDLARLARTQGVLIKLDRDGMVLALNEGLTQQFPAKSKTVFDTTGAGDMVLAALGLGIAGRLDWPDAIRLSNIAAGIEVERIGVATVSRSDITSDLAENRSEFAERVVTVERLLQIVSGYRRNGKTIAFTNGCFDILHAGHVSYLNEAAQLADELIVAINSDSEVRRLKGRGRPIMEAESRGNVLASLACVSHVTVFEEPTPCDLIQRLRPDVLVKGGDYTIDEVVGAEIVKAYGGRVCVTSAIKGLSTTKIVESMAERNGTVGSVSSGRLIG
jgi:D-beta-D-heptose 7-phosphate kinase/D-beta-D-heptose 1-phosphate adenosyltransferase